MTDKPFKALDAEELAAHDQAARLAGLEDEARVDAARKLSGCHRRAFIQLAMSFCRQGDEPLVWGRVAVAAAEASPLSYGPELLPLAWATLGNAYRVADDMRAAERAFLIARDLTDDITDPLDLAKLNSLDASLSLDLCNHGRAETLLRRAIQDVQYIASSGFIARLEVKLGLVLTDAEETEEALKWLIRGLLHIDAKESGRLFLSAAHNLAFCLAEQGRYESAMRLTHRLADEYQESGTARDRVHRDWLVARITANRGHHREACDLFQMASEKSEALDLLNVAGAIHLDRAGLLLTLGRFSEASLAAAAASNAFTTSGSPQELLTAVLAVQRGLSQQVALPRLQHAIEAARRKARRA
ncbi:MAG: hypothetical protein AAF604_19425 [Acidobacteriota bacterium]